MRPLLSTSAYSGMKTVLQQQNCKRTRPPASVLINLQQECRNTTLPHTCGYSVDSHRVLERILVFVAFISPISCLPISHRMSSETSERIHEWCRSPSTRASKILLQYSRNLLPDRLHSPEGDRLHQYLGGGRALVSWRAKRRPSLHFAKALSFSVCVQGRCRISASRSAILSRVRPAHVSQCTRKSIG